MTGLWMIFGPYLGCGKTAFLVWLAKHHKAAGRKIYANFDVTFADLVAPSEVLLMRKHSNATILIDELWVLIDSRQSTSGENKFLNDIILSSRKRGVTIAGTSQMPHMVDKRFRDIADYRVLCERKGKSHSRTAVIKAHITTSNFRDTKGISLRTKRFKVGDVCDSYNTDQIIEQDQELYITEMAQSIRQEKPQVMRRLQRCETITEMRDILQTFASVKRSLQVAILQELGVR